MDELLVDLDTIAVVSACSNLPKSASPGSRFEPFPPGEWSSLALALHSNGWRPSRLIETAFAEEFSQLSLHPRLILRLSELPSRAQLAREEIIRLRELGIWTLVRFQSGYPMRWREKLSALAPPVMFGSGQIMGIDSGSTLSIVGSRDIGEVLSEIATHIGSTAARSGYAVVSGGARGSDRWGMYGALRFGGLAVGVLHGDLLRECARSDAKRYIASEQLCLMSHVHPDAGFTTANAMIRNRYIHALGNATIVISTARGTGGTWSGSMDNLKRGWSPLLVWTGDGAPEANHALVDEGGFGFAEIPEDTDGFEALIESARIHTSKRADSEAKATQQTLFP